ncbi:MAG: S8 family serine peptidase [Bacteroidota bacterium]
MKVTVSKYLNVRVGAPRLDAPNYQYLAPGSILEVDGKLYQGQPYDGNTVWFRDLANNYYWSGGVANSQQLIEGINGGNPEIHELPWHIVDFGIHEKWNTTKGDGVNIAILDSGCYPHDNFVEQINSRTNFLNGFQNIKDNEGHGTFITGIIASNGIEGIFGVAPKVQLHIGKIINRNSDGLNPNVVASAINHYSDKVDIINLSLGFMQDHKVVRDAVDNCQALVVAAHGNDSTQKRTKGDYPALNENCLAVGSLGLKDGKMVFSDELIRASGIDIVAPGEDIRSTYKDGKIHTDSGSSMATAYVSGVLALLKSEQPHKHIMEIKDDLLAASNIITENNFNVQLINLPKDLLI